MCASEPRSLWDVILNGNRKRTKSRISDTGRLIRDLRQVFNQWDVDQSGSLDFSEFQRGFLAAGIESTDWDKLFAKLDADKDASISFEEFETNLDADQRR